MMKSNPQALVACGYLFGFFIHMKRDEQNLHDLHGLIVFFGTAQLQ